VFYHQFLTSAIAVLFLASTHAPLQFSTNCRAEFHMALELVKDMSSKSWVSQRLWRTVRSLKAFAPRLGLQEDDPQTHAAMAMAGMASGQPGSSMTPPGYTHQQGPGLSPHPATPAVPVQTPKLLNDAENGLRLTTEMARLFEGYSGLNGLPLQMEYMDERTGRPRVPSRDVNNAAPTSAGVVNDQASGVFEQFKDMF
jgi:hypothetical protein